VCDPDKGGKAGTFRLIEMAKYIERHALERLTLASLAEVLGISPSRFQRVFKTAFGIYPKDYQDAIRMQYFKKSIKEVRLLPMQYIQLDLGPLVVFTVRLHGIWV